MEHTTALAARLAALRPLTPEQVAALRPMVENDAVLYTYATNAIEGSTLTLGETSVVLEYGITVGGKSLRDHLDATNGARAFARMLALARGTEPITEEVIKDLHAIVAGADAETAGLYRSGQVYIRGSRHVPPSPHKVRDRMKDAVARYEARIAEGEHPVVVAAALHFDIAHVHPFPDYNGRTSRLVMNLHLLQFGYVPVIVDLPDRAAYLDALERASVTTSDDGATLGNPAPFVPYIVDMEERSLRRYLAVLDPDR